jgi:hypothetical protein
MQAIAATTQPYRARNFVSSCDWYLNPGSICASVSSSTATMRRTLACCSCSYRVDRAAFRSRQYLWVGGRVAVGQGLQCGSVSAWQSGIGGIGGSVSAWQGCVAECQCAGVGGDWGQSNATQLPNSFSPIHPIPAPFLYHNPQLAPSFLGSMYTSQKSRIRAPSQPPSYIKIAR